MTAISLEGAAWLARPLVRAVVAALGADEVRFVGGAVRDTLVGRPVADIDAATRHRPDRAMALLRAAGIKVVPTGLKHGTVTAVDGDAHIEITTLRHDVRTDGRHAQVAFTDDWRQDAARRDFTMNALYVAADGTVFDPFDGTADLAAGHVRFIGDPEARIREDVLRILRFFRFQAWYGRGAPDAAGLKAAGALAGLIAGLSAERVRDELLKLMAAPDPAAVLAIMVEAGIAGVLPGPPVQTDALARLVAQERQHGLVADPLMRLAAAVALMPASVPPFARALRLSGVQKAHLAAAACGFAAPAIATAQTARAFVYRHGPVAAKARLLVQAAGPDLMHDALDWPVPAFPVRGRDLIARDIPAGPQVTVLMRALETLWVESDFKSGKTELLGHLPELIRNAGDRI